MTPEQQRIAIAEACGWKREYTFISQDIGSLGEEIQAWIAPDGTTSVVALPDYLNDLNAMHEAEKVLDAMQRAKFAEELAYVVLAVFNNPETEFVFSRCSLFVFAHATASQRAEAFLRTIGRWIE